MKKIILALGISAFSFVAAAQDSTKTALHERGTITIRSGISIPKGKFGAKTNYDEKTGFADQGFHVAAEYTGYIDNYFGLGLTFGIRRNPFDVGAFNNDTIRTKYFAHTSWRTNYLLANTIFKFPVAPVLALYFKVGGGITFNTHPDINTTEFRKSQSEFLSKSTSLAYGVGSGIKWQGKKVGVNFEGYSLFTNGKFWAKNYTTKKELNAINYSFGLSYKVK
ncbi:outer membrane beta-barrel protein [Adhaeribacter soli]|uniref:Porin family protein n=1 Tax=Adhaeribacter soli TaxID=2607655 RepID=A0A5N1IUV2_9BACT|nr:outer membrane beta-barrel protein [Adhaeribacter soli]KAA9332886.1 porin family protein [Adhaeribacter soli]